MKKFINMFLSVATILAISTTAFGAEISIDDKAIETSIEPTNVDGRIFVPLRVISENLDYEVNWVPEFSIVLVGEKVAHQVGTTFVMMDDNTIKDIGVPSYIDEDGNTMVSIRLFSEALDYDITWDEATSTANIITK